MKPIKVNNDTYTSVAAAWRALSPPNLPLVTVRWRLKQGWVASQALKTPVVDPENRRTFPEHRSTIN